MTNIKNMNFISLIVLAAINLIVFYPSFYNCAKADHIVYLVETAEMESLPELIGYSYSYCRTRVLLSGDRVLFRPIFYIVLSIEKWLWGYNFIYWQLTGFFLHLIIMLALLAHRRFVLRLSSMTVNNNRSGASFLNKPFLLLFLPVSYLYVSILDYTLRFSENGIAGSLANINVSIPAVKFLYQFIK